MSDGYDLTEEIDAMQARLGELEHDLTAAIRLRAEARVKLVESQAAYDAARAEVDIVKARIMAKQSILRAVPR